ncbi:3'(2'),5'-bisphosphate nucleotidase 1 isoform X1 [Maniola hyperantus]|uniref:3'(2'),5'-bisphosphate nucleotidase 1 isoform X1 n=1 Tax=Aphantopus hyperantus TaxID=2795564 RepID=UPI001568A8D5|nr:3'(2'),5'-bisphosphate nucleotidase 1 [Maniola hyperantus]XP_034833745.1 3'(2'),5'-bisphosphate nucleotidase 1 [Maniola hyperantus]
MSTTVPLIVRLLASSVSVAGRAGKIVRDVMSKGELGIIEKGKDDYQTEADRSAQRCIIASLSAQYPKVNIIGEEDSPEDEGEVSSEWLVADVDKEILSIECPSFLQNVKEEDIVIWVDPLDGTSEYTQGALMLKRDPWERWKMYLTHPLISIKWYLSLLQSHYGFLEHVTVLIGISVNEKPVAGVIHQPYFKTLVDGEKKIGRTIWGLQEVGVGGYTPAPPPDSLVITTTRSHSNPIVEKALQVMNATQILRVGGAGYKVLQLLEGVASVYVFASPGCKKWDTCAPEAILNAAGGKLTDILGNYYKYGASETRPNKTGVLAAVNDDLHAYALNRIPQELKEKLAKQ